MNAATRPLHAMPNADPIDIAAIRRAATWLETVASRTPLLESPHLNALAGRRVLVKAESLQRTGSFKFRGAWNALSSQEPAVRAHGVIAYSPGNHAQGIAQAGSLRDIATIIVMPADAPARKLDNTRALGAEVSTYDRAGGESRETLVTALVDEQGLTLVRPFDDRSVLRAMRPALEHLKIVVEPGGAVALAAALEGVDGVAGEPVVCVATGGNVDTAMLQRALTSGD